LSDVGDSVPAIARDFAFLDHPGPIPFAHRGGALEVPENTMPAFQYAVDLGYRYVETDVHATADGVLMAFHDHRLDRVTDRSGRIDELSYDEVSKARVHGTDPIPRLADLLTAWPALRVNIDPKHDTAVEPLVRTLREHRAVDRVCVGAFSDERLEHLRAELGAELCTSLGPKGVVQLRRASWRMGRAPSGVPSAQVPVRQGPLPITDRRFVDTAHANGIAVHVWTIDDEAEMNRLFDLGVDGLMTDRPSLLKKVLLERNAWA
jgi:glycerophosphoryl diester phosphodiesterase